MSFCLPHELNGWLVGWHHCNHAPPSSLMMMLMMMMMMVITIVYPSVVHNVTRDTATYQKESSSFPCSRNPGSSISDSGPT